MATKCYISILRELKLEKLTPFNYVNKIFPITTVKQLKLEKVESFQLYKQILSHYYNEIT